MADIARSISDFSREGVDLPPNQIEATSQKFQQEVPKQFLSFYQAIISFISQYQTAFENENFDRMAQFVVSINDALIKYFNGDSFLKTELEGISEDTAATAAAFIKSKQAKSFSEEEINDKILSIVSKYKEKILNKIRDLKTLNSNKSLNKNQSENGFEKKNSVDANTAIDSVNEILKANEISYEQEIEKFSIRLGSTIVKEFKTNIFKLNEYNLKSFEKGINKLSTAYASHFYNIVTTANATIEKSQGKLKTGLSKIGRTLKNSAITMVNTVSIAITGLSLLYLSSKAFVKTLWFWGGKVLAPVKYVLGLGLKLTKGIILTAFKAVKFAITGVYSAGKFLVKTSIRVLNSVYGISKKIWNKIVGFSLWGFVKGAVSAFIFSYPGAYFLGYISGKIWRGVLHLAGISDEDIGSENYRIKDDVLMPLFQTIKTKIVGAFGEGKKTFDDWKEKALDIKNGILDEFQKTNVYKKIMELKEQIAPAWKMLIDSVQPFIEDVTIFYKEYAEPVARVLASIISVFGESPTLFVKSRMGAMVGLTKASEYFVKHVKLRGGIAGLLASAIVIGSGFILGMNTKKQTEANADDEKNPLKMPIEKKYAFLFGKTGDESETDEFEVYRKYATGIQLKKEYLSSLLSKVKNPDDKDKYNKARTIFSKIRSEIDFISSSETLLNDLREAYRKDTKGNNAGWKASDYEGLIDLIRYNDKFIIDPNSLDTLPPEAQINLLESIIKQRLEIANSQMDLFGRLSKGDNALEKISTAFSNLDENFLKVDVLVGGDLMKKEGGTTQDFILKLKESDSSESYDEYKDRMFNLDLKPMQAPLMRAEIKTRTLSRPERPTFWNHLGGNIRYFGQIAGAAMGLDVTPETSTTRYKREMAEYDHAISENYKNALAAGYRETFQEFLNNPEEFPITDIAGTFNSVQTESRIFQNTLINLGHIANQFQNEFIKRITSNGYTFNAYANKVKPGDSRYFVTEYGARLISNKLNFERAAVKRLDLLLTNNISETIRSITSEAELAKISKNSSGIVDVGYKVFSDALHLATESMANEAEDSYKSLAETIKTINKKSLKEDLIEAVRNFKDDELVTTELLNTIDGYINRIKNKETTESR